MDKEQGGMNQLKGRQEQNLRKSDVQRKTKRSFPTLC